MTDLPDRFADCPPWVDPAWWEVLGPVLRDRNLTGHAWIDALAEAWCLVRITDALSTSQLAAQKQYADRLLGLSFLPYLSDGDSLR